MYYSEEKLKYQTERMDHIKNIRKLTETGNFSLAVKRINEFFKLYDNDVEVLFIYGKILRKTGHPVEAERIFKQILDILKTINADKFYNSTLTELFKIYFINDNYDKAYELLNSGKVDLEISRSYNSHVPDDETLRNILEIRLGIYKEKENESSLVNRMLHYNRGMALAHVKQHLYANELVDKTVFVNCDIDYLFEKVENVLPSSKRLQKFSTSDIYMFRFDRIGAKNCNKLQVITNKGTYEIVSMYPIKNAYRCIINDNLYEQYLEEDKAKTKKISQIDKFNKRYGLK